MMIRTLAMTSQPSLRGQLLKYLALPLLLLAVLCAVLSYVLGKQYANRLHDQGLVDNATSVVALLQHYPEAARGITEQAQFLIAYDVDGAQYFDVTSSRHGRVGGNFRLHSGAPMPAPGERPRLDVIAGKRVLRVATVSFHPLREPADTVYVTVGETLEGRRAWAREILLITLPALAIMATGLTLLLVVGIAAGLRILDPLTARLRAQGGSLNALPTDGVPVEVMPLAQTINELLRRLREAMQVQNRFIADAAHQLRTPLAGLDLQALRISNGAASERDDAAAQVRRLATRTSRIAEQLLALARAQASHSVPGPPQTTDLSLALPRIVSERVAEALRTGMDLGYEGDTTPVWAPIGADALQDAIDNLLDNALRYAGPGASITVTLAADASDCILNVDDSGPGVAGDQLEQLGARFFRPPGTPGVGSGLGLSIVEEIVDAAGGDMHCTRSPLGGLRVTLRFPHASTLRKGAETPAADDLQRSSRSDAPSNPLNSSSKAAPTASS